MLSVPPSPLGRSGREAARSTAVRRAAAEGCLLSQIQQGTGARGEKEAFEEC